MARSYLFPGLDVEHLSTEQRQLERLYDQIDRPGNRITPQQFFKSPEYGQFIDQQYGSLASRVPPGSQIVSQDPFTVTYRDPDGYETTISRGNSQSPGTITTESNRPAVLPNTQQQNLTQQLGQQVQQRLGQLPTLADLPPDVAAQLQAISDAEVARNQQAAQDAQGQLVAQLYGRRVNQSSIANNAAARFAQLQGLVGQQQQSDAANRNIAIRQLLTTLGQQQNQDLASLYANLSGQGTQRDIASAGLGLDMKKLQESARQFDLSNYLQGLQVQTEQEKLDAANSPFQKFIQGLNAAAAVAGGVGTGLSAYSALTKPK